jgi:hypothetical protein
LAVLVPRLGPKGMAAVKKFTMLNRWTTMDKEHLQKVQKL